MLTAVFVLALFAMKGYSGETVTISGQVTDFEGRPIDRCNVLLYYSDFSTAYETMTDKDGKYVMQSVKKGKYMTLYALRLEEYPRGSVLPKESQRLEFWAWNVIADRDLIINPRYHRLELYGTNAFKIFGGYDGLMIYFRPMSLGKLQKLDKDLIEDK